MNEMMTTKRRRRQFSAEDRRRWTELYNRSGQSVRDFCRDHPLCQSSLSRWLRQMRTASTGQRPEGALVEVRMAPRRAAVTDSTASVKVRLPGGVTMEVASGTDAAWVAGVLRALQPTEVESCSA